MISYQARRSRHRRSVRLVEPTSFVLNAVCYGGRLTLLSDDTYWLRLLAPVAVRDGRSTRRATIIPVGILTKTKEGDVVITQYSSSGERLS
jgi:hypothetical protein